MRVRRVFTTITANVHPSSLPARKPYNNACEKQDFTLDTKVTIFNVIIRMQLTHNNSYAYHPLVSQFRSGFLSQMVLMEFLQSPQRKLQAQLTDMYLISIMGPMMGITWTARFEPFYFRKTPAPFLLLTRPNSAIYISEN